MKKFKGILTGTLLIMTLGMLTACGNNNNAADETGTVTEENDMMGDNADDNVNDDAANATANENNADANSGADDAALDNGDTMSEGTGDKWNCDRKRQRNSRKQCRKYEQ